jgi:Family of unknown function (DUF5670)
MFIRKSFARIFDCTATQFLRRAPYHSVSSKRNDGRGNTMLWTIFVILLVLWLVGLVSFHAIGAYIHILLVIALVVLLIQLISGRRAAL